ncbi:hypothetical protein VTI74DRAFT_8920 [Chaetomium olivicolor]
MEARGPKADPEKFGFLKPRYVPAWKTVQDGEICRNLHQRVMGNAEVLEMVTARGQPFRTVKGASVADVDIWWAFSGAVKDLAYQGVEVAVVKCGEGEGMDYMGEEE